MLWARFLVLIVGLMCLAGIIIAAAGTHAGGGDLARLASEFLLIHAAVVLSLAMAVLLGLRFTLPWLLAASCLAAGTILFSADLATIAFSGERRLPWIAPMGGTLMAAGWAGVSIAAALKR